MVGLVPHYSLSHRQRDILRFVIEDFIETASPVPSRRLKEKFDIKESSATIRSTLHALEDIGLLDHVYTSSGRIPTDFGYRFYVDELVSAVRQSASLRSKIMKELSEVASNVDLLLEITADSIGKISHLFGFVCLPFYETGRLTDLELVPLSSGRLLFVLGFQADQVKSIVLDVSVDVRDSHIETLVSILRERLLGLTMEEIQKTVGDRLKDKGIADSRIVQLIIDNADIYFAPNTTSRVSTSSKDFLLQSPEFRETENVQAIVSILDDDQLLLQSFAGQREESGIHSSIGRENSVSALRNCSVVARDFRYGDLIGQLGVIGPTRMDYGSIFALVETVSETLSRLSNG